MIAGPVPRAANGRPVLAVDITCWLRPAAHTTPAQTLCHNYGRGAGRARLAALRVPTSVVHRTKCLATIGPMMTLNIPAVAEADPELMDRIASAVASDQELVRRGMHGVESTVDLVNVTPARGYRPRWLSSADAEKASADQDASLILGGVDDRVAVYPDYTYPYTCACRIQVDVKPPGAGSQWTLWSRASGFLCGPNHVATCSSTIPWALVDSGYTWAATVIPTFWDGASTMGNYSSVVSKARGFKQGAAPGGRAPLDMAVLKTNADLGLVNGYMFADTTNPTDPRYVGLTYRYGLDREPLRSKFQQVHQMELLDSLTQEWPLGSGNLFSTEAWGATADGGAAGDQGSMLFKYGPTAGFIDWFAFGLFSAHSPMIAPGSGQLKNVFAGIGPLLPTFIQWAKVNL